MNFIDANVFIHSFLKPKRKLSNSEIVLKQKARNILKKIDQGEKVLTSTVHVSECINILEAYYTIKETSDIINSLLQNPNIKICSVEKNNYITAVFLSKELNKRINDCLAIALMKKFGISQIYSFDKDFDKIPTIKRVID
ncbi:type II toxin-antitoxin system VapC family toxin [Candidatus Woesearchaeota archaeon]|nr:type II toxin-antitoxin system VapC family toxin [Candidatus Woesearchaeota archaeon]